MTSKAKRDIILLTVIGLVVFAVIAVGGLWHPNTLAGGVARFILSLR